MKKVAIRVALAGAIAIFVTAFTTDRAGAQEATPAAAVWPLDSLLAARAGSDRPYLPFLRVPSMHAGLYVLEAGAADGQRPHGEDELYYVTSGAGKFTAGGNTRAVSTGSLIFVKADVEHRFHDITERLEIVVFFSTAESR